MTLCGVGHNMVWCGIWCAKRAGGVELLLTNPITKPKKPTVHKCLMYFSVPFLQWCALTILLNCQLCRISCLPVLSSQKLNSFDAVWYHARSWLKGKQEYARESKLDCGPQSCPSPSSTLGYDTILLAWAWNLMSNISGPSCVLYQGHAVGVKNVCFHPFCSHMNSDHSVALSLSILLVCQTSSSILTSRWSFAGSLSVFMCPLEKAKKVLACILPEETQWPGFALLGYGCSGHPKRGRGP
jgi:hypothetical protein